MGRRAPIEQVNRAAGHSTSRRCRVGIVLMDTRRMYICAVGRRAPYAPREAVKMANRHNGAPSSPLPPIIEADLTHSSGPRHADVSLTWAC